MRSLLVLAVAAVLIEAGVNGGRMVLALVGFALIMAFIVAPRPVGRQQPYDWRRDGL